jgi:membrane dipeptidase
MVIDMHLTHPRDIVRRREEGMHAVFETLYARQFSDAGVIGAIERCGGDMGMWIAAGNGEPGEGTRKDPLVSTLEQIDAIQADLVEGERPARIVREVEEWEECRSAGQIGLFLELEGLAMVRGSLTVLRLLVDMGVRVAQLTWNYRNDVADGVGVEDARGLTSFGISCVDELQRAGVVIDLSHLAERGMADVLGRVATPVIASHSNADALRHHPRNLRDEFIVAVAEGGGVVGVCAPGAFVSETPPGTLADVADHVEYMVELVGIEHVGLGSDFFDYARDLILPSVREAPAFPQDDFDNPPDFSSVPHIPDLVAELRRRGFSDDDLAAFGSGNFLRAFREVRAASRVTVPS